MPPKLDREAPKEIPSGRINVVASANLLERLEEWRVRQKPVPNKSEAARLLIASALEREAQR